MVWPRMVRVVQRFEQPSVADPSAAAVEAFAEATRGGGELRGTRVAVTVGSRGIADLVAVVRGLVGELHRRGAEPFIVPAMGSHGGGTAEGQRAVLATLGVTEESVDAPIRSSMETVQVGTTEDGFPVLLDRLASAADHVLVVNRVKPHTEFAGPYQSGLLKMLLIGLGKHAGAIQYHAAATRIPFERLIRTAGRLVLDRVPILAGIAIIENAYDGTAEVVGVPPAEFFAAEERLLARAAAYMATVPFDGIDLLIIDEMGKNISGAGIDTNVIRRKHWADAAIGERLDPGAPKRIFVRDLTSETQGNAAGIGIADFTLRRLADKIDRHKTYTNTITATRPRGAVLPLVYDTDEEAILAAIASAGVVDPAQACIARIRNTLRLTRIEASENLLAGAHPGARIEVTGAGTGIRFDDEGMLTPDRLPV